jgi:hypothetical protein
LEDHLLSFYGTSLDRSFNTELAFLKYLKEKRAERYVFWDLEGRSQDAIADRTMALDFLEKNGLTVNLKLGQELRAPDKSSNGFVFRIFAYTHFATNNAWDAYLKLPKNLLKGNEIAASSFLFDSKVFLALLWEDSVQSCLSADEVSIIKRYIPRSLRPESVSSDKMNEICDQKDHWVLKKGTSFQGRDVILGREASLSDWRTHLKNAIGTGGYIIQEFIKPTLQTIESTDGDRFIELNGASLMNFYYVDNHFSGMISRFRVDDQTQKIGAIDGITTIPVLSIFI